MKVDRFYEFKELYIFDLDDTLVETPSFEDKVLELMNENKSFKEIFNNIISDIGINISDIQYENGRVYFSNKLKFNNTNDCIIKGNRVYLKSPDIFSYLDESLPIKPTKYLDYYNKVSNKCILTARQESIRNKIINKLIEFDIEYPNYGLYMRPDNLKNAGTWKGNMIINIANEYNFKNIVFIDDNSKYIKKVKTVLSNTNNDLNIKIIKAII